MKQARLSSLAMLHVYYGLDGSGFMGNAHQILLSEMSLLGNEVLIEKLLPKILRKLGKENPSKRRCKVAFVQCKCAAKPSVFSTIYTHHVQLVKQKQLCMHAGQP